MMVLFLSGSGWGWAHFPVGAAMDAMSESVTGWGWVMDQIAPQVQQWGFVYTTHQWSEGGLANVHRNWLILPI